MQRTRSFRPFEFLHSQGQTEKSGWSPPTSVVPLKADIQRAALQVRFVPKR
jgi:hypothetical protein